MIVVVVVVGGTVGIGTVRTYVGSRNCRKGI